MAWDKGFFVIHKELELVVSSRYNKEVSLTKGLFGLLFEI